jgi:uroporphyrinogen-III decarboxylase
LIEELTATCCERIIRILDVLLAKGNVDILFVGGSEWLTPPMGSPELYDRLVHTYEAKVIEKMHEHGTLCHLHCHGNIRSTFEKIIRRGADFTEPVEPPPDGDISFAEAKERAAGRITLGGNIESRIIERENLETVEETVRTAFEGGRKRMVLLTTARPLTTMTSLMARNYHRAIDLWEELSPII